MGSLPTRAAGGRHQAGIGRELTARVKAGDRADLRRQNEGAEHPDSRHGGELRHDGIALRGRLHVRIQSLDFDRQRVVQREQPLRLGAQDRGERGRGEPGAPALAIKIRSGGDEILRHEMPMDAILETGALPHEEGAAPEKLPAFSRGGVRQPDGRKQVHAQELRELPRIDRICFRARLPDELHVEGVGDADDVFGRRQLGGEFFLLLVPWGLAARQIPAKGLLLISFAIMVGTAVVFLLRSIPGDPTASWVILPGLAFIAWGQVAAHLSQRGLVIASLGLLAAVVLLTLLGLKLQPGTLATAIAVALSIITTAAAFAMVHGQQLAQSWSPLFVLFVVGTVLTLTRAATKSVASSFLIHLGYNFTLFGGLYLVTDHFRHMERMVR